MKRIVFAICALVAVAAACTPENKVIPAVSFETALPVVAGEVATYTIAVADYAGTDPVTIPVTFGGDAVKGVDYEVSAEAFVWGGTEPVTSIKVTTLVFDDTKKVTLTLNTPDGWIAGNYPMSESSLSAKLGYVSFEKSSLGLTGSTEVKVSVYDENGNSKTLENDATLAISVAATSTAVENTHFTLSTKEVTIPAGSSSATFTIAIKGDLAVAEHDELTLVLDPGAKFSIGNYDELEVVIWDSAWSKLDGTWVMNSITTDATYFDNEMGYSWFDEKAYVGLPEFNAEDKITFNVADGVVTPAFKSTYKNFFIGESKISKGGSHLLRLENMSNPRTADVQIIVFENVNRYFHETEMSADKEAYVGVRIITDEATNAELLDLYVIDYESKSFINLVAMGYDFMYNPSKPVADSPGMFLNATFKRAN